MNQGKVDGLFSQKMEKGHQQQKVVKKEQAEEESDEDMMESSAVEEEKKKKGVVASGKRCCQAEKCKADLTEAKPYHRRHKVCEYHAKEQVVLVGGMRQRFCQQCSRLGRFYLVFFFFNFLCCG
jgi:hypothetical protein